MERRKGVGRCHPGLPWQQHSLQMLSARVWAVSGLLSAVAGFGGKLWEHCGGKPGAKQVLWHRDQWYNLWHLVFSWIWGTHSLLWNKILSIKPSFTGGVADISLQEMICRLMCVLISNTEIKSKKCCWFYGLCQYWEWVFNYDLNYSSS